MHRVRRSPFEARMELTPLLDMMFLLLVFFIFAFALIVRVKVTDIHLPATKAGGPMEQAPAISVALLADGSLRINDEAVSAENLIPRLRALREQQESALVYVAADEKAPSGELFRLIDSLQGAGVSDLRFLRLPSVLMPPSSGDAPAPTAPGN